MAEMDASNLLNYRLNRRRMLRGLGLAGLGLGSAGLVTSFIEACGNPTAPAGSGLTPKMGGTLIAGVTSFDATLTPDPLPSSPWIATFLVFEGLTRSMPDSYDVVPALAESWTPNQDTTQWTFHLRSGVQFHDGTPFTAQDAAYSFARILDPANGAYLFGQLSASLDPSGIKVQDDHTLVLNLKQPDVNIPFLLGTQGAQIVKNGTPPIKTAELAIGTGPFKMVSFTNGQSIKVVKSTTYWNKAEQPYLDSVEVEHFAEPATMLAALESGTIHLTAPIGPTSAASLNGHPNVKTLLHKNNQYYVFVMDPTQAPFTDTRVIQAFKLAVDRKKILQAVFNGNGTVTADVCEPPGSPWYPQGIGSGAQDITQAKQLLSAAGHPNGIDIELITAPQESSMVDIATAFASTMSDAGIRISVKTLSNTDYGAEVGSSTLFYEDWFWDEDPFRMMQYMYGPGNEPKYNSPDLNNLVNQALATQDASKRNQLISEAMKIGAQEASQIIPVIVDAWRGVASNVYGAEQDILNDMNLRRAWIDHS